MVVGNAGATNTGSVDPLDKLNDFCRQQDMWLHVDAAYGWPAALIQEGREALRGIEQADSITLDPHKWFGQTFEAGCVLIRDGKALAETFQLRPEYMQDVAPGEEEINFADHGIALTRRFRALKIWFSMKVLGVGWYRRLIEHCCRLAEYAEKLLEEAGGFEILCPRQLSIVCFRFVPPAATKQEDATVDALNLAICERVPRNRPGFSVHDAPGGQSRPAPLLRQLADNCRGCGGSSGIAGKSGTRHDIGNHFPILPLAA